MIFDVLNLNETSKGQDQLIFSVSNYRAFNQNKAWELAVLCVIYVKDLGFGSICWSGPIRKTLWRPDEMWAMYAISAIHEKKQFVYFLQY